MLKCPRRDPEASKGRSEWEKARGALLRLFVFATVRGADKDEQRAMVCVDAEKGSHGTKLISGCGNHVRKTWQ